MGDGLLDDFDFDYEARPVDDWQADEITAALEPLVDAGNQKAAAILDALQQGRFLADDRQ
jgi:hypothetical protein